MSKSNKQNLLVIVGPTASGKSDLAVQLAEKLNGEVISADSRQVYKGLDIGTGKITKEEMHDIPHHLLDIADPHDRFTAIEWKKQAEIAIDQIASRGKLPIICGGTGFYISSLIDDLGFPAVEADTEEQKKLEMQSAPELFEILKKLDPERAKTIDLKNKRRLSRAIIIARALGSVPEITRSTGSKYDLKIIGIKMSDSDLRRRIFNRIIHRMDNGMIQEVEHLHAPEPMGISLSYARMEELGLEYKYISQYLQHKINHKQLLEILNNKIWQYAKRQMTWWKKDGRIQWIDKEKIEDIEQIVKILN